MRLYYRGGGACLFPGTYVKSCALSRLKNDRCTVAGIFIFFEAVGKASRYAHEFVRQTKLHPLFPPSQVWDDVIFFPSVTNSHHQGRREHESTNRTPSEAPYCYSLSPVFFLPVFPNQSRALAHRKEFTFLINVQCFNSSFAARFFFEHYFPLMFLQFWVGFNAFLTPKTSQQKILLVFSSLRYCFSR